MSTVVKKPRAFGVGLIALDLVIGADPESPVQSWAGGTCGNVLSILAYLGWNAFPIARMNGDPASERVRADMMCWGVRLDFTNCPPTSHTPIIIQEIRRARDGTPTHRFSWSCPRCGQWLPGFKSVTRAAVDAVAPNLPGSSVFFMDRVSRAALTLAARASKEGAVVIFEPSGKSDPKLFQEAIQLAHVVKYADQRLNEVIGAMDGESSTLLEIKTSGSQGLQYRHRLGRGASKWLQLNAVAAPRLTDTCGSGDWCTAGVVSKLAASGQAGLLSAGADGVREALRYGQALAAWNCAFEGARGGMYAINRRAFDDQIECLLRGQPNVPLAEISSPLGSAVACPACPRPDRPRAGRAPIMATRYVRGRPSAA
ncbi:MAG: PfkB family carbohydrate kinase [Xanthobacteraceae bacterium]